MSDDVDPMGIRHMVAGALAEADAAMRDLERWEYQFERRQAEIQRRAQPEPEAKAAPRIAPPPPPDVMEPVWTMLRAAYDFLAATSPFCEWDLPPSSAITFDLENADRSRLGYYSKRADKHVIGVRADLIGRTSELIEVLAHEVVHLHRRLKYGSGSDPHDHVFRKLARQVCSAHGFDLSRF
jgi:SprT-like family